MDALDSAFLGLHVLGALLWVGGSIALGAVVSAGLRRPRGDPLEAARRISRLARRIAWVMWPGLVLAIATGLRNLTWFLPNGFQATTAVGELLSLKFVLVAALVITGGAHTFWAGPKARHLRESDPPRPVPTVLSRLNGLLGAGSMALGLAAVIVGVLLAGSAS